ncbi:MAG: hypothetical protein V9E96_14225 [Chitinophagaceae bacterium]
MSASFAGDVNVAGSLKNNGLNVINTADTSSLARKLVQIKNATNDYLLSITDINNLVAINSTLEKNIEVPNSYNCCISNWQQNNNCSRRDRQNKHTTF